MLIVVAAVFIVQDDRVLLVEEAKAIASGKLGLPGGKLERGETLQECAIRETLEETGYDITIEGLLAVTQKPKTHEGNTVIKFVFAGTLGSQAGQPELAIHFVGKPDVEPLLATENIRGRDIYALLQQWSKLPKNTNLPFRENIVKLFT